MEADGNTLPLAGTGTAAPILAGARRRCRLIGARAGGIEPAQDRDADAEGADATNVTQTDSRGATNIDDDGDASERPSEGFTLQTVARIRDTSLHHPTTMPMRSEVLDAARTRPPAQPKDTSGTCTRETEYRAKMPSTPHRRGPAGPLTEAEAERVRAIQANQPLVLPAALNRPLAILQDRLANIMKLSEVVLGGGTILAARYDHRVSTDLDLFFTHETSDRIHFDHGEHVWVKTVGKWLDDDEPAIGAMGVTGTISGIDFSIFPASEVLRTGNPQPIDGYWIRAQTTHEILEGKIMGRIADSDTPNTIRDLYDLTIAARMEPDTVATVMRKLRRWPPVHERAIKNLRSTPADLHLRDPQAIMDARYDIDMQDLGGRLVELVESADPESAPPAEPIDGGRNRTGHQR